MDLNAEVFKPPPRVFDPHLIFCCGMALFSTYILLSKLRNTGFFSTFSVGSESCFFVSSFLLLSGVFMICSITSNWETNHSDSQFPWRTIEFLFQSVQSICTDCKGMSSFNSVVHLSFCFSFCRIYEYRIIRSYIKRRDYLKDSRELC